MLLLASGFMPGVQKEWKGGGDACNHAFSHSRRVFLYIYSSLSLSTLEIQKVFRPCILCLGFQKKGSLLQRTMITSDVAKPIGRLVSE